MSSHDAAIRLPGARALLILPPLFLQSYLLVGEQTPLRRRLRSAIGLFAALWCLSSPYTAQVEPRDRWVAINFAASIAAPFGAMRAIEWAIAPGPYRWIGLDREDPPTADTPRGFARLQHALSQLCSMRGIGWNVGARPEQLAPPPPRHALRFLRTIAGRILVYHFVGIFCAVPVLAAHRPGPALQALQNSGLQDRVLVRWALAASLGTACWAALELGQAMWTLCAFLLVSLLAHLPLGPLRPCPFNVRAYPALWPRSPWSTTSVSSFWTSHWHALFLQPFQAIGFQPARKLARRLGKSAAYAAGVLAVFVISGVMHEIGLYYATRDLPGHDLATESVGRTQLFFIAQAVGIVLEGLFKSLTGRRVSGWVGRLWTYAFVFSLAAPMLDEWIERGLMDNLAPVESWDWRRWIIPLSWTWHDRLLVQP